MSMLWPIEASIGWLIEVFHSSGDLRELPAREPRQAVDFTCPAHRQPFPIFLAVPTIDRSCVGMPQNVTALESSRESAVS